MATTAERLTALIANSIEDPEPWATILKVLQRHDGKLLTKRHVDEICRETGRDDIYTSKRWATDLVVGRGQHYHLIRLSDKTVNVKIDASFIHSRNLYFFDSLLERNAQRQEALKHSDVIELLAEAIDKAAELSAQLDKANGVLGRLYADGTLFEVCQYAIGALAKDVSQERILASRPPRHGEGD